MRTPVRFLLLWAALVFATTGACSPPAPEAATACTPQCGGERVCGDDGCGGTCGECPTGESCSAEGVCGVDCDATCADLGLTCGEHCGQPCGDCDEGEICVDGACECAPACEAATCEQADGCGGTCGPCTDETGCEACALKLVIHERHFAEDGTLTGVVLAVHYDAPEGATPPTMADVRLLLAGPAQVTRVGVSPVMLAAGKRLVTNPRTGRPWLELGDGSVQVLVAPDKGAGPIGGGEWLFFEVSIGEPDGALPTEPAWLSLVAREGTLAPEKADEVLWGTEMADPIVLWAR